MINGASDISACAKDASKSPGMTNCIRYDTTEIEDRTTLYVCAALAAHTSAPTHVQIGRAYAVCTESRHPSTVHALTSSRRKQYLAARFLHCFLLISCCESMCVCGCVSFLSLFLCPHDDALLPGRSIRIARCLNLLEARLQPGRERTIRHTGAVRIVCRYVLGGIF